jgi:hypothetical protein
MRILVISRAAVIAVLAIAAAGLARAAAPLPRLNVDAAKTTVSGLSSGAFMANQLGYAYSAPSRASACLPVALHVRRPQQLHGVHVQRDDQRSMLNTMQADINNWSGTSNDNKSNVANQKIFMFVGTSDYTVGPNPMNGVQTQYANSGVPAANLTYVSGPAPRTSFPTDFDATGDNACNSSASPYISNCGYDGAGAMFAKFYGALNARNNAPPAGNYIQFDQTAFSTNPGLSPSRLGLRAGQLRRRRGLQGARGAARLPAELRHHRRQVHQEYRLYALGDTNSIIVLFPQTKVDNTSRSTSASGSLANANGCWDWIGWYGTNFAQKSGCSRRPSRQWSTSSRRAVAGVGAARCRRRPASVPRVRRTRA